MFSKYFFPGQFLVVYGIVICNPSFHRDDRVDRVDGKAGRSSKKRRGGHTHTHTDILFYYYIR